MLNPRLKELADKIRDEALRVKVLDFLEKPTFELNGRVYVGVPFEVSPGGLAHHHTYKGGYLEHVFAVAALAESLCDVVEQVYHGKVNRDLVRAGVLLHDIFKPITYTADEQGNFSSSDLADRLDHISLATTELVRRNFPIELVHVVTAHYGSYGPTRPRTIEALVVHLADNTDSQLNGQVLDAAYYLTRKATGEALPKMDSKEAFEVVHAKADQGWRGVQETVEKIRRQRGTENLNDLPSEEKQE